MKLTERESQIYNYIVKYMEEHMYAPAIRDIGEALDIKSTSTVFNYLSRLAGKGLIEVIPESPRAIKLVGYSIVPNTLIEELNKLRAEKEASE